MGAGIAGNGGADRTKMAVRSFAKIKALPDYDESKSAHEARSMLNKPLTA
jgi:hypothetical protein